MTKRDLYDILQRTRKITDNELVHYMVENPTICMVDALLYLSGANRIPCEDGMKSVKSMWENVSLVAAIKEYRRLFGGSTLQESKDAVQNAAMAGNWQRNLS